MALNGNFLIESFQWLIVITSNYFIEVLILLNMFFFIEIFPACDMPGYGYAAA